MICSTWPPANIHAIGRNYVAHIQELGNQMPSAPVVFSKSASCLTRSTSFGFPEAVGVVHFELELVLQLGEDVPVGGFTDLGCVVGMALGLDFTARALQTEYKAKGLPWHLAKSFENACFVGPLREFRPGRTLFQLFQNGALVQDGDSDLMIYSFQTILEFINQTIPLCKGDLIFTGTPQGVGPVKGGDQLRLSSQDLETDLELQIR